MSADIKNQVCEYMGNKMFQKRYIKQNAKSIYPILHKRKWKANNDSKSSRLKHTLEKYAEYFRRPSIKKIFAKRLEQGKIDIPYIEIVLTTKCTLNCQSCNNLMQYFDSKSQYTGSLDSIIQSFSNFLKCVSSVQKVRIIGGEPLLFKDLPKLVEFLNSQKKVRSFDIVTNATIKFSPDLLDALQKSRKSHVAISDYSKSPNLKVKTHIESIVADLSARNIPNYVLWQNHKTWYDPGKIYKRGRSKEDIVKNFKACHMTCISMSDGQDVCVSSG